MFAAISLTSFVGDLTLYENEGEIISLTWESQQDNKPTPLLTEARNQLNAYFSGNLKSFELPLCVTGSSFQKTVCDQMRQIPYGETWTYGDIAERLGTSAQPVGGACGRNPIPILIPCHRVMGANDAMTGFSGAGGIATKKALLTLEGWQPMEPDLFD